MPFPVSWTNSSTFSHPCGERKPKVMLPLSVNFAALLMRLLTTCLSRDASVTIGVSAYGMSSRKRTPSGMQSR